MRITFVIPVAGLAGGIRVVAIYARILAERGHRVTVVSLPWPRPSLRQTLRQLLRGRPWRQGSREGSHLDGLNVEHRVLERHRAVVDTDVPDGDVVVATWWETAEWVAGLSPAKGVKVLFLQHHEVFDYLPVQRVRAVWRLPIQKIVVAQWLADVARDQYGDPSALVVPNAVDMAQFHAEPRDKQLVPAIGLMYSAAPFKGTDISLEALRIVQRRIPEIAVTAFSAQPPSPRLPLPPGTRFHLRPPQDRLRDIYAACDAWLFASRTEGFGLPILEAMACRTPVIATPAGAAPELIAGGGGWLVRHEDPQDMADAIERVCRMSPAEWRAVSDRAYQTASGYSWEQAADCFEQALRVAVERSRRAPAATPAETKAKP